MKITIATKTLRENLDRLARLPGAATAIVSSMAVTITAGFEDVSFLRYSPNTLIKSNCDAEVHELGAAIVPFLRLQNIAANLNSPNVTMEAKDDVLEIRGGGTRVSLKMFLEMDREQIDGVGKGAPCEFFDRASLVSIMHACRQCAHTDDAYRANLCGVGLYFIEGALIFFGGDGKIMHAEKTTSGTSMTGLIHNEMIDAINSALRGVTDDAAVLTIGESAGMVQCGGVEIIFALSQEKLPNIEPILKLVDSHNHKCLINKQEAIEAIKACGTTADSMGCIEMSISADNSCTVKASNAEDVEIETEVTCKSDFTASLKFVPKQLLIGLSNLVADEDGMVQLGTDHKTLSLSGPTDVTILSLSRA